jgi:hypothetical protein
MKYEIDHIFILASEGAPEAQSLIDFGLTEGPNRIHKGQGTQNRCFFFNNVMLELLWVYDEQDAQNESTLPTTLWSRWENRNFEASAFGLCLRRAENKTNNVAPFESWKYQPELFPKPMYVSIAISVTNLEEPFIFYSPMGHRPDNGDYADEKLRQHTIGFKELTSIGLSNPNAINSDAFTALLEHKIIKTNSILNSKIELQFDGGKTGNKKDFSPVLPLVISW